MSTWVKKTSVQADANKKISFSTSTLSPWAFVNTNIHPPISPWKDNDKATWAEANAEGWGGYSNRITYFISSVTVDPTSIYNIPRTINGVAMTELYGFKGSNMVSYGGTGIITIASASQSSYHYNQTVTTVSFPNCKTISTYAFFNDTNLTSIYFPECTLVGSSAFDHTGLVNVNLPKASWIQRAAFSYCKELKAANLPECKYLDMYAFYNCSSLETLTIPKCESIGYQAFAFCNILNLDASACKSVAGSAFQGCANLSTVSLPVCSNIAAYGFANCTALTTVYVLSTIVPVLNSYAFSRCSNLASIYVQPSLVESFKTAKNWSDYASKITAFQ